MLDVGSLESREVKRKYLPNKFLRSTQTSSKRSSNYVKKLRSPWNEYYAYEKHVCKYPGEITKNNSKKDVFFLKLALTLGLGAATRDVL